MEDRQAEEKEELNVETEAWTRARPAERLKAQVLNRIRDTREMLVYFAGRSPEPQQLAVECARMAARITVYKAVLSALQTGELE